MKMEDLTKRLRASDDIEKCCLASLIESKCSRIKEGVPEERNMAVSFLHGCLETLLAFGEITREEQDMLWRDVMKHAYGGPVS